jgi:hypothetical protein
MDGSGSAVTSHRPHAGLAAGASGGSPSSLSRGLRFVRRTMEGRGAAHLHRGLPAGGGTTSSSRWFIATPRPAQCAGDLHRRSGRRAVGWHPRRIAGYPGCPDHPDRSYRITGLPAHERGSNQARRRVALTAHHLNAPPPCHALPQEVTGSMGGWREAREDLWPVSAL